MRTTGQPLVGTGTEARLEGVAVPLLLVHSPLVGPATWDALAEVVRKRRRQVFIPDLTGSLTLGPPYWSRQVDAIAASSDGRPAILVAHSGAGPLMAAASGVLEQVVGYVFVDASLPFPGRSWVQTAPPELVRQLRTMERGGWLPPWSEWWGDDGLAELLPDPHMRASFAGSCPQLPMAMFEEIQPPAPGWPDAPCAYLRLSDTYEEPADQARELGWLVNEVPSHHLGLLTNAERICDPLLDLVDKLIADDSAR